MSVRHASRVRVANDAQVHPDRPWVLYWMTAARRTRYNQGLEHAVELSNELRRPLVVFEPLRCDYDWASDRLHGFVIEGMLDNRRACADARVAYVAHVEQRPGSGGAVLEALAREAAVVVTDDYPAFFLPAMLRRVAARLDVRVEAVDGNGLIPMRQAGRDFPSAYAFRRWVQRVLPDLADRAPAADPLAALAAGCDAATPGVDDIRRSHSGTMGTTGPAPDFAALAIDHDVGATGIRGGARAAGEALDRFLERDLAGYHDRGTDVARDTTSRLSPYLHFGHLSCWEIFGRIAASRKWHPDATGPAKGQREGWWGMDPGAEAFLDQLIVWRELGFNFCAHRDDYDRIESLPDWARETLAAHRADPRPAVYDIGRFERAATHDPLWNATQRQLIDEGRIHGYLRMLWGKKILHWSESPSMAIETMIHLNNKYALDGRDPNSYSGIFWCLGRYDRPWGPEREVFGKVRFMTSRNTARKLRLGAYIERYSR